MINIKLPDINLKRSNHSNKDEIKAIEGFISSILTDRTLKEAELKKIKDFVLTRLSEFPAFIDEMDATIVSLGNIVKLLEQKIKIQKENEKKIGDLVLFLILDNKSKADSLEELVKLFYKIQEDSSKIDTTITILFPLLSKTYTSLKSKYHKFN